MASIDTLLGLPIVKLDDFPKSTGQPPLVCGKLGQYYRGLIKYTVPEWDSPTTRYFENIQQLSKDLAEFVANPKITIISINYG